MTKKTWILKNKIPTDVARTKTRREAWFEISLRNPTRRIKMSDIEEVGNPTKRKTIRKYWILGAKTTSKPCQVMFVYSDILSTNKYHAIEHFCKEQGPQLYEVIDAIDITKDYDEEE